MSQELLALQAHQIAVRLIQSVPQLNAAGMMVPTGPGVGPQVNVLGVNFVPSWAGINGPRGYTSGQFELRLYEEGTFQLDFPNAEGEDGALHRKRFLILNAGRMTPTGGNATSYAGGAFRPGDEYFEIYRTNSSGAPGKLLTVGAVTKASVDSGKIVVSGADAFWLLKKTRETTAGFHTLAPRDFIEHYTKTKQVVLADDFPQDSRFTSLNNTTIYTTSDNVWLYRGASNQASGMYGWGTGLGTVVRLTGAGAYLQTFASPVLGSSLIHGFGPSSRIETRIRAVGGSAAATTVLARLVVGGWSLALQYGGNFTFGPDGSTYTAGNTGVVGTIAGLQPSGYHGLAIEFRDRFIHASIDGTIVGTLPNPGFGDLSAQNNPAGWGASVVAPSGPIDIDHVVIRQLRATMLRPASAANLGDYRLGGLPAQGSCQLQVWRTEDLTSRAGIDQAHGPQIGSEFSPARVSQRVSVSTLPSPSCPPNDPNVGPPNWWPNGAGIHGNGGWACRAAGALKLTLDTYDYRFAFWCDDYARLWVGKTRSGEQLADNWQGTGHAMSQYVTPYLLNPTGVPALTLRASVAAGNGAGSAIPVSAITSGGPLQPGQLVRIGTAPNYEYAAIGSLVSGSGSDTISAIPALAAIGTAPMIAHSSGDPVVVLNQGSLAGQPSGWYPFIFEFGNILNQGSGGAVLLYERSDQPGWWNAVGSSSYLHQVYTTLKQSYLAGTTFSNGYYWPLNTGTPSGGVSELCQGANATVVGGSGVIGTTVATLSADSAVLLNGGLSAGRTGDAINCGNIPISTSSWTVSATFRCDVLNGTFQEVLRKDGSLFVRINSSNVFEVQAYNGTAWTQVVTSVTPVQGVWYHVVGTWDGTTIRVYVNGALVGSGAFSGQATNTNSFIIGAYGPTTTPTGEWFNGAIGHVFLSAGAMTVSDVTAVYNSLTSSPHISVASSGVIDTTAQPVRLESHYDRVAQTTKDFGMQIRTEPMKLESGEFPGRLRPLVRVGRDTEFVVGSPAVRRPTGSDIKDDITAEEVCDILSADAQGLADPLNTAQLVAEFFGFGNLGTATGHPWVSEEYDQQNNISIRELLLQRLSSELVLRGSPWEQVSVGDRPERQLIDTFPLTGSAAEFDWTPGDGARLNFPELGVVDSSPRQVLGIIWPITPAGLGAPSISLRQRPRNFGQLIRDMLVGQLSSQRSYQGQFVTVSGNTAGTTGYPDTYSRVNLPNDLTDINSATLVVQYITGGTWNVEVNDAILTNFSVSAVGRYDLTPYVAKLGGAPRMYVRLTGGAAGTLVSYQLEVLRNV